MDADWIDETRAMLRAELLRKHVSSEDLVIRLQLIGVEETLRSVRHKLSRGSFSFAFFLQCMAAIETERPVLTVSFAQRFGSVSQRFERYKADRGSASSGAIAPKSPPSTQSMAC